MRDEAAVPLPPTMSRLQFWLLICSTIGVFVGPSLVWLMSGGRLGASMSNARLLAVVALELVLGLFWARRLRGQGWTLAAVTEPLAPSDLLRGVALAVAAVMSFWSAFILAAIVAPAFAKAALGVSVGGHPSAVVVLLVSIVNPVAEEFLYLGVIAATLRRQDTFMALSASLLARLIMHLYQGPLGILSILPFGLLFGAYYLRTRRLWPVVAAHALLDAFSLAALS